MIELLFVCTHNRCRSILCEAIANHACRDYLRAYSAGSQPEGSIHPKTLAHLQRRGISTAGLSSQSWDEYHDRGIDIVITVCDQASNETCPVWIGSAFKLHWGLNDASKVKEIEQDKAFNTLIEDIEHRVNNLCTAIKNSDGDKRRILTLLNEPKND